MPRIRIRNAYQNFSEFDNGRIVAYRDCGLSYCSSAASVGGDSTTFFRILNRWVPDGDEEHHAGSHRHPITSIREDTHATQSRFCLQHQDGRILVWRYRDECLLAACIQHLQKGQSPGVMVWCDIGKTSRSPLVCIDGTLNSARYISSCYDPWLYPLFELCENMRFSRIVHDRMLPVSYGPPLIRKKFSFWPGLHVHQISCQ
ncbi:transposable element Tcb1 transposase [Trichonephila clavipes]|nr:transposable element Tcb1 transposase [Trichonephila clavipes]